MNKHLKVLAKIKKQEYINNKSQIIDTGLICEGVLYSGWIENEYLLADKVGKNYFFITKSKNIQPAYILEIDGVDYRVKATELVKSSNKHSFLKVLLYKDD